jgi:hypothetical protein
LKGFEMWILIITMYTTTIGSTTNGSINAKFKNQEDCFAAREQIVSSVKINGYKVSASCTYIK